MGESSSIGVMFRREQHPERLVEYARRVEAAGFDELWVVEDCFYMGGIAQAATALAVTSDITVGLGIAPAVARNPSFLAMELATLANMHPGRVHGGIGHGVAEWMDQIGARPESWLAALEETTTAVRALLAGETVTMSGRFVHLDDVRLEYPPASAPPISLGVQREKSLALSGRCADGTILVEGTSPEYVRWALEQIGAGTASEQTGGSHRVTVYALCDVDVEDPAGARGNVRRALAPFLAAGSASPTVSVLPYAEEVDALAANGGSDRLERDMPDAWLDDLAVAGTPEQCLAAIERLRSAGADAVVLVPPADLDADAWLDRVSTSLLPVLRPGG